MQLNPKTIGQFTLHLEGEVEELALSLDPLNLALTEGAPVTQEMIDGPCAAIRQLRDSLAALERQLRSHELPGR
jgi:hypothetical protein